MRIIVEVTPGWHTNSEDLARVSESVRLTLSAAVDAIAADVFPEYVFTVNTAPECSVCGGPLERSEAYPDAGYLHRNDADDTHVPCHTPPF